MATEPAKPLDSANDGQETAIDTKGELYGPSAAANRAQKDPFVREKGAHTLLFTNDIELANRLLHVQGRNTNVQDRGGEPNITSAPPAAVVSPATQTHAR